MNTPNIEQLDRLISKHIGDGKTIVDQKISRLTSPGENFGSEMLKVDLVVESKETRRPENVHIVAKLIPRNDFFKDIFNVQVSFRNESAFYSTVVPALQRFQTQQGLEIDQAVDFFPKFFGSRCNLADDERGLVDDDAVLLLENLKIQGYENVKRLEGFDFPTALLILDCLARFHAVPLALKLKEPETFETKVKPFLACFHPMKPKPSIDDAVKAIVKLLESSENCKKWSAKVQQSMGTFGKFMDIKEPMATVTHTDLWVNNILVKFVGGAPESCRFVDFQGYNYGSPAVDVLFFLFTSIEFGLLREKLDGFLEYYVNQFNEALKQLNCDYRLTLDRLIEEIKYASQWELAHVLFMTLMVVHAKEGGNFDSDENITNGPPAFNEITFQEKAIERVLWVIEEWGKRGWLNY
ncbi:unnamed protein product [Phyllotreta striolata]|uniref:CHK kinase-like domain-containing protein n=1 Tax=Phyllotreta striolata TaxID=444603 RepID=A0A9N9XWN1_PHYSR|nr:unnamed protein product [Phyllotreta striolata]